MWLGGGWVRLCSYSLPSRKTALPYAAFPTGSPSLLQWEWVGMRAQVTVCSKVGKPDPTLDRSV